MAPDPSSSRPTPPQVQQINVRTDPPQRSGGGATMAIVAIVGILALLAVVYFVFLQGDARPDSLDVNVEVPEVQAPEMPDVNIEVPDVELPDVELPDVEMPDGDTPEGAGQ